MRLLNSLRRLISFLPLALAVAFTLHAEEWWLATAPTQLFLPFILWTALIVGWLAQQVQRWYKQDKFTKRMTVFPVCVVFLMVCGTAHIPLRILFWTQQNALGKARQRAPLKRQLYSRQPHIGMFRPLQISKSVQATRFILWENEDFLSGSAVGFAHCPNDAGCSLASFDSFYSHSEGKPQTVQISRDWVAVSVHGSDF